MLTQLNNNTIFNFIFQSKNHNLILILLMILGIVIRTFTISNFPSGFCQDEASIGYEAYSILTTGVDRNNISYPIHLISWGSGQNALYAYLSMPFIQLFGLNEFSVRIVNALFSILSLLIFYLIIKLTFGKKKALIGLGLLVICPWSIISARWGLESNIFPTLFLLSVFFMLKGVYNTPKYFPFSFLFFSISLYAYGTSYLVVPLFLCFTVPYLFFKKYISLKYSLISISVFFVISSPILLFILINHFDFPQIHFFDLTIPRLISNRTTVIFNLFSSDFINTVSQNTVRLLSILIAQSDRNEFSSIPTFGTIYHISFPFFIVGLFNVLKNKLYLKQVHYYIFCVWLFCSLVLGVTSHVNITRINIIFFPLLYFVVLGIFDVYNMLFFKYKQNYKYLLGGLYTVLFVFFSAYYITELNDKNKDYFTYGIGKAIQYAEKIDSTSIINVTADGVNMPYIYVCFYNKINPDLFRESVIYDNENYNGFRVVKSFDRYTFGVVSPKSNTIHIFSKTEMLINKYDISKYKNFGNYYIVNKLDVQHE